MRLFNRLMGIIRIVSISILFMSFCACAKAQDNSQGNGNELDKGKPDQQYDYTVLTPEYLKVHDPNYLFFRSFDDAFPELSKLYPLEENAKKIIGAWNTSFNKNLDNGLVNYGPIFFPNKLLIIWTDIFLDQFGHTQIQYFFGVWSIKGNTAEGKITGYAIIKKLENDQGWDYSFTKLNNQINCELYDFRYIHKDGYTLKPFKDIPITKEIQEIGNVGQDYFKGQLASRYYQTKDLDGTIRYGLFKFLPEMATKNISGELIVSNPDKYKKYLSFWSFWKYK
jgi:hypothetical protein